MPNKDGTLTLPERDWIAAWLHKKGKNHVCPVCANVTWDVGPHLLSAKVHTGGNLTFGGPTYPQVFIICANCAYVRCFMAKSIGLLDQVEVASADDPDRGR